MMSNTAHVSGSLRNRLTALLIGGVALLAIMLYFVVRSYATQIAQHSQDSILTASVTSMLDAAVIREGQVEMDFPYASFSMLSSANDDRIFYVIYQDEEVLSGYEDLPLPSVVNAKKSSARTTTYRDVAVRQITASRQLIDEDQRTNITVSLAQSQDSLAGTLKRISQHAAVFGSGFFLLAMLLSIWATSATIAPLQRLANSVARRGPQDLSPVAKPVPSEMAPLVTSLNSLMDRLERSLNQSEDFIAEAAHRVRTPIATVRSHAEATLQRVDKEENRKALRSMIRAIDESSRAAGQLLDHAMIVFRSNQLEFNDTNLYELVHDITLRTTPIAEMKDVELCLDGEQAVWVSADPLLLENAIRNLIDNALKYSPAESTIQLSVRSTPTACVEILDQGPGFPNDEISILTQRFKRGRNAGGIVGSGLGLTIAKDVANAHGGKLTLSNGTNGGACVSFSF